MRVELLDDILIEQYTIASETIKLATDIGMDKAIKSMALKFGIEPIDLALIVKIVLDYEVKEFKGEAILKS